MAGIGFVLRNLNRRDDLIGVLMSYGYSGLISTGPWILTSLTLGGSLLFGSLFTSYEDQAIFRIIIIYNFAFSLVFSGPALMVATRYLSDLIFEKQVEYAPGLFIGAMILVLGLQMPLAIAFYGHTNLEPEVKLLAVGNFVLIAGIWLVSIFLSALKSYNTITRTFAVGMASAMVLAALMAVRWSVSGMLLGFNLGLGIIFFSLAARVFSEYHYPVKRPFAFLGYFRKYWELAASGLFFNLAAWADKWIMWFSPQRDLPASGMISYPDYDSAMFLAYLTVVPSLAIFMVSVETSFFEKYNRFFKDVQRHKSYARLKAGQEAIVSSILKSGRNLFIIQGVISAAAILAAPSLFQSLSINYLQLSIFRVGVLGAFFHIMMMFLTILLSYFDFRRPVLKINLIFMIANAGLTLLSLKYGFKYYGFGYFISSLIAFSAAYFTLFHHLERLPFYVFIRNNPSIR